MYEVTMPKLGMAQSWCVIEKWHKKEGDEVKKGDLVLEVSTDKITYEVEAKADGIILEILKREGEESPVGEIVAFIGTKEEHQNYILHKDAGATPSSASQAFIKKSGDLNKDIKGNADIKISALAKKIAENNKIDISIIKGTGPQGRITVDDVNAFISEKNKTGGAIEEKVLQGFGDVNILYTEELTKMRKIISEKMVYSKMHIPHIGQTSKADITKLADLKRRSADNGTLLSYSDFFIKIVATALKDNLKINSALIDDKHIVFSDINIGIVTIVPNGLMIPVIKDCDKKDLVDIAKERKELTLKVQENNVSPGDVTGGTFTISNLGNYNVRSFSAIIYPPQASILTIGKIYKSPEVVGTNITIRDMVELTVFVDHRILDGADGAKFLTRIIEWIENPELLVS